MCRGRSLASARQPAAVERLGAVDLEQDLAQLLVDARSARRRWCRRRRRCRRRSGRARSCWRPGSPPRGRCRRPAGRRRRASRAASREPSTHSRVRLKSRRVLEHGAGDDLAEPLALEAEAGDQAVERGGQHVLVGRVRVGAVGAGERDAVAADDGDPAGLGVHRVVGSSVRGDLEVGGRARAQAGLDRSRSAARRPRSAVIASVRSHQRASASAAPSRAVERASTSIRAASRRRCGSCAEHRAGDERRRSGRGSRRPARRSRRRAAASRRRARAQAARSVSRKAKKAWTPAPQRLAGAGASRDRLGDRRRSARRPPAPCRRCRAAPCCRSSCRAAAS